jgi:hypothetical protein
VFGVLCVLGTVVAHPFWTDVAMGSRDRVSAAFLGALDWPAIPETAPEVVRWYWLLGFATAAFVLTRRWPVVLGTVAGVVVLSVLDELLRSSSRNDLAQSAGLLAGVGAIVVGWAHFQEPPPKRVVVAARIAMAFGGAVLVLWALPVPRVPLIIAGALVALAWRDRSAWLAVVAGLFLVLPSAPWPFGQPSTFTTLTGYEMSTRFVYMVTMRAHEVLLPGLLLIAAALFGALARSLAGWVPLLGTGLGVFAFSIADLVDRFTSLLPHSPTKPSGHEVIVYLGGVDPTDAGTYFPADWPDLTPVAIAVSLLTWSWVRRDVAVGATAVAFAYVAWPITPAASVGWFFTDERFDDFARFWNDVPAALTPACVLLSGAAVAFLSIRTAPRGFR